MSIREEIEYHKNLREEYMSTPFWGINEKKVLLKKIQDSENRLKEIEKLLRVK